MSDKDLLIKYKNYLYALMWYREFGNKYGDKIYIDIYEEKIRKREKMSENEISKRNV